MEQNLKTCGWLCAIFGAVLLLIGITNTSCGSTWNVEGNKVLVVVQETDSTITVKKNDQIITLEKNDTITKKNEIR